MTSITSGWFAMTLVSSLKSVGLISETVTIIKRTEELKCFIWHWIITYVRNNDVRDTCFKKSSLTGPLFFFLSLPPAVPSVPSWKIYVNAEVRKTRKVWEKQVTKLSYWKMANKQIDGEKLLPICLCLLSFITQTLETAVSVLSKPSEW